MRKLLASWMVLHFCMSAFGQDISGEWNGRLSIQNTSLRLVFHIQKTDAGYTATMDSPDQGAKGIAMSHVTFQDSVLTVELRIAGMKYVGNKTKNTLTGTFSQGGVSAPLNLVKNELAVAKPIENTVELHAAFVETPLVLETKTGKLAGTLTMPKVFKNGPIALIIAGSGPTDRNGNNPSMTNDAYKKLAHELAENNIASLRYDKRGIAQSAAAVEKEADLVFYDYVRDASEWITFIKLDKRFTQVVVIGHSEGSLIGMLASTQADKFVSIAGPGRSADVLLKEQLQAQPKAYCDLAFPMIDSLVLGKTVSSVDPSLQSLFRPSIQPYLISWFKYNPQTELKKLTRPILIVQGTNDIQVSVEDAKLLTKANPTSQLLLIDKMNHILRTSSDDRQSNLATYSNAALPLADNLVKGIADFILKK